MSQRVARRAGLSVVVVVSCLLLAEGARALLPQQTGAVDLLTQANLEIDGAAANAAAGTSVAGVGDVNGDGRADVLVGVDGANTANGVSSGAAALVFGGAEARVDLGAPGQTAVPIIGAGKADQAGVAVAGPGDVNGDGRPDLLIGADLADQNTRGNSGSAYVVFGAAAPAPVDLAALGPGGFRIDGAAAADQAGEAVAGAGDVNGDGRADVLIGAERAGNNARPGSGSAYVVFGSSSSDTVDLANLGARGFRIDGAAAGDALGLAVAGAGDVNGDGRADVLVGAFLAGNNGRLNSGSAYVVFGSASTDTVDLANLGTRGFRIDGAATSDVAGRAVAGAGDVNGDGRADLLVGAPGFDLPGRTDAGSAYLVFGKAGTATVDLAALGAGGFRIDGAATGDETGAPLAGAEDVTGDGRPDVVVGAAGASANGRLASGSAWVVSLAGTSPVDLANPGDRAFRIDGAAALDAAGLAVAGAGDVNGDGRPDVLVGAPHADPGGRVGAGAAYTVLGFGVPELAYPALAGTAGVPIVPLVPTLRRTGPASFQVAPPLPPGLSLDPASGVISGTPQAAFGPGQLTVTMSDLAGQVSAPLSVQVGAAPGSAATGSPTPAGGSPSALRPRTPVLSKARATCARARRATARTRRAKRVPCRIALTFRLSAAARVRVVIRRAGTRTTLGTLSLAARPGVNRVVLPGRLGRRTLGPGTYRLILTARQNGLASRPLIVSARVRESGL